jgi:hypothetical protein
MRVARLVLENFRGFRSLEVLPRQHVALIGEPRSGRSSILSALRLVLDPLSLRARPNVWDIRHPFTDAGEQEASVEVTLLELGSRREQALDVRLELFDSETAQLSVGNSEAVLGVRLRYCVRYLVADESIEHWIEYPKTGQRPSRRDRELLRAVFLDRAAPLQLRVEGLLRRITNDRDPVGLASALENFSEDLQRAVVGLVSSDAVNATLDNLATRGAATLLGVEPEAFVEGVSYAADDGSLSGLLRAIQPQIEIDEGGPLPLSAHGSTTAAILAVAEAATAAGDDAEIIVSDDFGEQLDSASCSFSVGLLRSRGAQFWMNTRRPEAVSSFDSNEIIRVSVRDGSAATFSLPNSSGRRERVRGRHLDSILGGSMSARSIVFTEGPHDAEGYAAVERRLVQLGRLHPLSSQGLQMVPASATGAEGGKQRFPSLAELAIALGFGVHVILDNDGDQSDPALIAQLLEVGVHVVLLPEQMAIERALVSGLPESSLRAAMTEIQSEASIPPFDAFSEHEIARLALTSLKRGGGLHRAFVDALPGGVVPEVAALVLAALFQEPTSHLTRIDAP